MTSLLNRARKEFEGAQKKAAADESAAKLAWQVARAAKVKVKQARKLSKLAKKSARKAEDKAEQSLEVFERAQAKLEKLQKRADKEKRKSKGNRAARKARRSKPVAKGTSKLRVTVHGSTPTRSATKPIPAGPARGPVVSATREAAVATQKTTTGTVTKTRRVIIQKPKVAKAIDHSPGIPRRSRRQLLPPKVWPTDHKQPKTLLHRPPTKSSQP